MFIIGRQSCPVSRITRGLGQFYTFEFQAFAFKSPWRVESMLHNLNAFISLFSFSFVIVYVQSRNGVTRKTPPWFRSAVVWVCVLLYCSGAKWVGVVRRRTNSGCNSTSVEDQKWREYSEWSCYGARNILRWSPPFLKFLGSGSAASIRHQN